MTFVNQSSFYHSMQYFRNDNNDDDDGSTVDRLRTSMIQRLHALQQEKACKSWSSSWINVLWDRMVLNASWHHWAIKRHPFIEGTLSLQHQDPIPDTAVCMSKKKTNAKCWFFLHPSNFTPHLSAVSRLALREISLILWRFLNKTAPFGRFLVSQLFSEQTFFFFFSLSKKSAW